MYMTQENPTQKIFIPPHSHAGSQARFGLKSIVPATVMYSPGPTVLKCDYSKYWLIDMTQAK